jgi:hypothetical protein
VVAAAAVRGYRVSDEDGVMVSDEDGVMVSDEDGVVQCLYLGNDLLYVGPLWWNLLFFFWFLRLLLLLLMRRCGTPASPSSSYPFELPLLHLDRSASKTHFTLLTQ